MESDLGMSILEEITDIIDSLHKTPKYSDSGYPMVRCVNLRYGMLDLSETRFVSEEIFKEYSSKYTPKVGDIIITRVGANFGVTSYVKDTSFCLGQNTAAIVPTKINHRYLYYILNSVVGRQQMDVLVAGAAQPTLSLKAIKKLNIPRFGNTVEDEIAHILGSLDDKIELNRQMNATLEAMAQVLFKSWFVDFDLVIDNALAAGNPIPEPLHDRAETRKALGGKRKPLPEAIQKQFPSNFVFSEEMGWIPEGWTTQSFGGLVDTTIGGDWGKEEQDEKHGLNVIIVRGTDIPSVKAGIRGKAPSRWVEQKKYNSRVLQDGDIVIEVSGGSPKQPTGRSVYMTKNSLDLLGGAVVPASFCRKFRPKSPTLGLYGALHLDRIYAAGKMWGYQNQSTGISNFQTNTFLDVEFVVLPDQGSILEEFFKIARPMLDKATTHGQEHLAALRDALLPKLLSGQLRIPDVEKIVQEAL